MILTLNAGGGGGLARSLKSTWFFSDVVDLRDRIDRAVPLTKKGPGSQESRDVTDFGRRVPLMFDVQG